MNDGLDPDRMPDDVVEIAPPLVYGVPKERLDVNEFSVNEEDRATYDRLKEEIDEHGMVEHPVIRPIVDSITEGVVHQFKIHTGHHRTSAWVEVEGPVVPCRVKSDFDFETEEAEFNMVNNMNLIRGSVSTPALKQTVREHDLDVRKLDIFKHPASELFPSLDEDDLEKKRSEASERARIRKLTMEVSEKLAETMLDERNELVSVVTVDHKLAAVVRAPLGTKTAGRKLAAEMDAAFEEEVAGEIEDLIESIIEEETES